MNIVRQGETYYSELALSGDDVDAFSYIMSVMQYPDDVPAVTRAITVLDGAAQIALTSVETLALAVGQWIIHVHASDADEDIRGIERINIGKGWLGLTNAGNDCSEAYDNGYDDGYADGQGQCQGGGV